MKAQEIKQLRARAQLTQQTMSSFLCISKRALQSYEQGTRKIPPWLVELIRVKCGVLMRIKD